MDILETIKSKMSDPTVLKVGSVAVGAVVGGAVVYLAVKGLAKPADFVVNDTVFAEPVKEAVVETAKKATKAAATGAVKVAKATKAAAK